MEEQTKRLEGSLSEIKIHKLVQERYSKNINEHHDSSLTLGDRIADKVASVAGSWAFIVSFLSALVFWIILNAVWLTTRPFDPYPFILLNLVLSCVAAIQAPIIMMSQNRQEEKDRLRAENDYQINLKSEQIVEDLHMKIDTLLENQGKLLQQYESMKQELETLKQEKNL